MAPAKKSASRTKKPATRRRTTRVMEEPQQMYQAPVQQQSSAPSINNILVIILIIVSFAAGYLYSKTKSLEQAKGAAGTQQAAAQQPQGSPDLKIKKPTTDEHWRGNKDARIVMVEYSDLECPFCKQIHPSLQKMLSENNQSAWVFRHFPLSFHPKAQKSAESTECATELAGNDGFWKMTDAIYDKMPALALTDLPSTAASAAGVDEGAMKNCIDSGKYEKAVKSAQDEGAKIGVQATPTTVFYDMKTGKSKTIEGAVPYEQLKSAYDELLKG